MPHATPQFHSAFYPHREPLLLSAGRERKETTIRVLLVHNNSNCCHDSEEHVISFLATIKYNTSYIRPLFVVGFKENNPSIFSSQTTVNCWHESEEHFISFLDAIRYNTSYISCKGIFYLRLPLLKSPTTRTVWWARKNVFWKDFLSGLVIAKVWTKTFIDYFEAAHIIMTQIELKEKGITEPENSHVLELPFILSKFRFHRYWLA